MLVLLSGGADSVCLLEVCLRLRARVEALHVNYGLRAEAGADEAHCRELCARLEVPLTVERVALAAGDPDAAGNLQAEAREARYALAEAHAGGDYASAHTASDQAETVLYRLAVSPGRRALLGMPARRGRLVRPLLAVTRAQTRSYCQARRLAWREDSSNSDPRFARARVRHGVLPVLRELSSAAERTIAETALLLRDEQEVLEGAVDQALARLGGPAVSLAGLRELPAGLGRLVLRRLAEDAAGGSVPFSRADAAAVLRLGESGGTQMLDLGAGVRAIAEYGTLRFARGGSANPDRTSPDPVSLPVPGWVRFGPWVVEARPVAEGAAEAQGDDALLDAAALGDSVVVRSWLDGDRMRPRGLGGSKSLQDLFTDGKVPRDLRRSLPVVEARGAILWVAGVAVGERAAATAESPRPLVRLSARRAPG